MKLTKIESYEIQAFAFRVMTGYMAPGKDSLLVALDRYGAHTDKAKTCEVCAIIDAARKGEGDA